MEPFFFTSGGRRLFATMHRPSHPSVGRGGWLLCGPFGEERGFAQRLAVEWACALAGAGFAALRFDYRGYGDSEGLFEEHGAEDHVEDILAAARALERRTGLPCRGLWGLRLGATLAVAAAARGVPGAALALWDPVVSGERYLDDLLRATMVKEMANTGRAPRTRAELKDHLAAGGQVVVEGHPLTGDLYRSIAALDLAGLAAPPAGPALILQFAKAASARPRRELEALRGILNGAAGAGAALEVVHAPLPWQQNDEYASGRDAPFAPTLRWMAGLPEPAGAGDAAAVEVTAREAPRASLPADLGLTTPDGGAERAVEIPGEAGILRGILHQPAATVPGRPAVLMVTPGFNCRTARYRLYAKLARELAARGWTSLRLDPRGIGDSDGTLGYPMVHQLYNAIEGGLFAADTRAGVGFLEGIGAGPVVLLGLCGGATTSVRVAAGDPRVAGVVASELPFLYTPGDQHQDAPAPVARAAADHFLRSYARKLVDPVSWRRFLSMKSDYRSLATSVRVAVARRLFPRGVQEDDAWYRERLGPRANLPLVAAFRGCLARRLPVLCLFGATRNSWYFAEIWPGLRRAAAGSDGRVTVRNIPDADPGFSLPAHTREFLDTVEGWLEDRFAGAPAPARSGAAREIARASA